MNLKPFYLFLIFLNITISHVKAIPTDTLLTQFYTRAAKLMEIGKYDDAQATFDSAFATKGVKQSPVYPVLLNEQATLLVYLGKNEEAFEMKKVSSLICLKPLTWKNISAFITTWQSFIANGISTTRHFTITTKLLKQPCSIRMKAG